MEGKAISLWLKGMHFYLSHDEVRQLRSEMNRILQRIHDDKELAKGAARYADEDLKIAEQTFRISDAG